jgi:predicted phage baseplate assembly protein
LLWQEVPFFYGHGPDEHIYITREDDSGNTTVTFGDGVTGSRLPTGQQNVTAQYRQGIGLGGLVRANQLSIMAKRPLGVRGATNPQASNGAADPEQIDDARQNATLTIVALDRVVSLDDYQNFARAFAGIAKAFATWTWSGEQQIVLLTVAGVNGQPVPPGTAVYKNLLDSISHHSEPFVSLQLSSYDPIFFQIAGVVTVDAVHEVSKVSAAVEAALRSAFSFAQRSFGQPVHRSEVVATIQEVDGVEFVDLNAFYRSSDTSSLQDDIVAAVPRPGKNEFFAAQLLMLNPGPLGLEVKQ